MPDAQLLNVAMSRFSEAAAYHEAIHALRLRRNSVTPNLTDEQRAKRLAMIDVMAGMLERARDEMVEMGIGEWIALQSEST